jgi:hypothetical protein
VHAIFAWYIAGSIPREIAERLTKLLQHRQRK